MTGSVFCQRFASNACEFVAGSGNRTIKLVLFR